MWGGLGSSKVVFVYKKWSSQPWKIFLSLRCALPGEIVSKIFKVKSRSIVWRAKYILLEKDR